MKIIKSCLFYLFTGIVGILTAILFSCSDTSSIGMFIALTVVVIVGWVLVFISFKNQIVDYLRKKRVIGEEVVVPEESCVQPRMRLRPTYSKEYEDCYHIALNDKVDRYIEDLSGNHGAICS